MTVDPIANLYDKIADNYVLADLYGSLSISRDQAYRQIDKYLCSVDITEKDSYPILDVGIGDGTFIKNLNPIFERYNLKPDITGLDVSEKMLALAANTLDLKALTGTVHDVDKFLSSNYYSLYICQFILAYVDINIVLSKAYMMCKAEGIVSLITTTSEGMSNCRNSIIATINRGGIKGRIINTVFKSVLQSLKIPDSFGTIEKAINGHNLCIIERRRLEIPVTFQNIQEFMDVGFKGGWIANVMDQKYVPPSVALFFARQFFENTLHFPMKDTHIIEVLLLKKK